MGDSHLRAINVNIQNLPITLKKIINGERTGKENGEKNLRKKNTVQRKLHMPSNHVKDVVNKWAYTCRLTADD